MTRPRHARIILALLGAIVSVALTSALALAQAGVVVQVRTADGSPGEARVTLSPEGGGGASHCDTQRGTCRITGLSSGRFIVTAAPRGAGEPPLPRPVLIPSSGEVTVSVTLR